MSTAQELTTRQLEILILFDEIGRFANDNDIEADMQEILTQDHFMSVEEYEEIFEVLAYYGYVDMSEDVTIDGKQYIALFSDYLKKREENPDVAINNSFTLISLENLNVGLNTFIDLDATLDIGETMTNVMKNIMQSIKNVIHK